MRPEHWHNFGYVFTCYLTTTGFPKQEISFCFIDQMSYFCNIGEFFLFSILPFLHPFPFLYPFLHPWTSCWSIIQTLRLVAFRRISLGSPTFLPIFRCLSPSRFVKVPYASGGNRSQFLSPSHTLHTTPPGFSEETWERISGWLQACSSAEVPRDACQLTCCHEGLIKAWRSPSNHFL